MLLIAPPCVSNAKIFSALRRRRRRHDNCNVLLLLLFRLDARRLDGQFPCTQIVTVKLAVVKYYFFVLNKLNIRRCEVLLPAVSVQITNTFLLLLHVEITIDKNSCLRRPTKSHSVERIDSVLHVTSENHDNDINRHTRLGFALSRSSQPDSAASTQAPLSYIKKLV